MGQYVVPYRTKTTAAVLRASSLMLTGEQIVDMMDRYVREHPSMGRVAWQLIMIRALQEVFPCTSARP
jgi:hypothetical protein